MLRNIIATFFQNGIWVIGFFYLLIKTFENDKLEGFSKNVIVSGLVILLVVSVIVSI